MCEHIAGEIARRKRVEILLEGKACVRCGETNAEMLGSYTKTDLHHVVGRANEPDLVVCLCKSCHAYAHAQLKEIGIVDLSPKPERNLLEVVALILSALGKTLQDWGERFAEYAERLAALIEQLDERDPSWRQIPEAQL